ncbi:tRNA pseudouridine(38/39) synthase-like isoform X2 [Lytechinus variegatus]|uniref:tRNA pseudouridine(38/39) synthase-like isoform X2 n=1 Tax=Lytechinus variegatus TaxID=7654 RepID=UPI001BB1C2E2|nr:tRNA pseudouridine(38/39) synthase-like isoform X2 [Lytechinus variegatus]
MRLTTVIRMASQMISKELVETLKNKLSAEEWRKVSGIIEQSQGSPSSPSLVTDNERKKVKKRGRSSKAPRPFDFTKYNTRHVALKITYLGWDYHGFVVQEDSQNTVEHHLFEALTKTKLIESRQTSNYSRCGRTDKGVSAFGQVIAIDLRTNLLQGLGVIQRPDGTAHERTGNTTEELNYLLMLNRVLPNEIRVIAWTPVEPGFSARFDTLHRTYKYFFPAGDLDTRLMNEASQKLVGTFDFRNFCKMDVGNGVVMHTRTIRSAEIRKLDDSSSGYQMYEFTISGKAFLYHQVRCITAILFLIGEHKEKPEIIDQLLDVENEPCKPQYPMAVDFPLVLYDCAYEGISWIYDEAIHDRNITLFQEMWTGHMVRASMMRSMLEGLTSVPCTIQAKESNCSDVAIRLYDIRQPIKRQATSLVAGLPSKQHIPLLDRQRAESLENRIEHFAKRRKVEDVPSAISIVVTTPSSS